ncbi:MAG TPA: Cys-tRNA(Pro) deacylase [Lachnospiraceae bacterium]|nr:Cys-tRNA(Pro) deacylase [Lachnospiraceae bacterium]
MAKEKDVKTNAMRILDRMKIPYAVLTYDCPDFEDGVQVADLEGVPHESSFKTLIMQGKSGGFYVFVLPIEAEADMKAAAASVGEKSVGMIHVKDITKVSGYVRGGCSPIGMKKAYPTVIAAEALHFTEIYVSGGRIGSTIKIGVQDLLRAANARTAEITVNPE